MISVQRIDDRRRMRQQPSFRKSVVHNPRKLFFRRALFQIHLWAGIFLALYVFIIALTGAILVFEDEFTATTLPSTLHPYDPAHTASIPQVMNSFLRTCPSCTVSNINTPSAPVPAYRLRATDTDHHALNFVADPVTAAIHAQPRNWVEWIHDLHVNLLLGDAHGVQINGVGAIILLILAVTGIVLWWPGLKHWSRGLGMSFRHNWRRINFDAHNAIGFWTLLIVSWWAISGIYFGWYRQVVAAVNFVSPLRGMNSPSLPPLPPTGAARASLESILAAARKASPQGRLFALSDPSLITPVVYAQMDLRDPGDFSHRDIVTIETRTARALTVWHYGQNHSLGDWFIWSMHPLHFGTLWGLPFKILWFLLGLALAVLSITGLLMYWNRYLRHRIKSIA
jgi:uncharacterized iron-regulated membrane protein